MHIAPLTPDRADAAVALWHAAGITRPWNDPHTDLARALAAPASTVLAGVLGDRLVATVMVGDDGHRGWVYYLAVDAQHRRRRLGAAMMAAAEAWLAARGAPKLNLMVRASNAAVLGFYEALGYTPGDVAVLQKVLTPPPA